MDSRAEIELGYVSGVYGVRGWLKIYSYTDPRDNILRFSEWLIGNGESPPRRFSIEDSGLRGKTLVAKLAGFDSREVAASLIGCSIFVEREVLPELPEDEYYWVDLIGLTVCTEDGVALGVIEDLMETGANDVLIVRGERERLIPFALDQVVKSVDFEQRHLVVDWDPEF